MPVLGLRPLSKAILRWLPPTRYPQTFVVGQGSGSHENEASTVYQAQTDQDFAVDRKGSALVRCARGNVPLLEPHNLVCLRFCQEPDFSRSVSLGGGRMGLVDVP